MLFPGKYHICEAFHEPFKKRGAFRCRALIYSNALETCMNLALPSSFRTPLCDLDFISLDYRPCAHCCCWPVKKKLYDPLAATVFLFAECTRVARWRKYVRRRCFASTQRTHVLTMCSLALPHLLSRNKTADYGSFFAYVFLARNLGYLSPQYIFLYTKVAWSALTAVFYLFGLGNLIKMEK